jgi:hypothetical protein
MKPVSLEATMMKRIGELKAERIHDLNQIGGLQEENARLKAEVERLTKAGDTLVAAYCMGDRNKERWAEYPVVREWLAAKGELP